MTNITPTALAADIAHRVLVVRNVRVLLDADLAALYGVSVRRLNEQVRRNVDRFPEGFLWSLTDQELANLKSQFATSSWGGKRKRPLVFTEHRAVMAATVLNSAHAVQMTIFVVRAFIELRAALSANAVLTRKLDALEKTVAVLDADSRRQFKELRTLVFSLALPPGKEQ